MYVGSQSGIVFGMSTRGRGGNRNHGRGGYHANGKLS